MTRFNLAQFEAFLKNIDLQKYREQYSKIKTVEMDLPNNIQALDTIYAQYWENVDNLDAPLSFDAYYEIYYKTNKANIEKFWATTGFGHDCDCFQKGLKARTYRTWASLITQIHGGYIAETVFGKNTIQMSTKLDRKKTDILITNSDGSERLKIQIKKKSHRPEIARMHKNIKNENGTVDIYYIVPSPKDYEDPYYKRNGKGHHIGDEKPFAREFVKWHPDTGTLDRLDNGFIVFTQNAFLGLE